MFSITYRRTEAPNVPAETARKSLFVRFLEAIVESRMRKAEEEIKRARAFWPIQ